MTMEHTGAAIGSAEIPSLAAEILIVLVPDPVSDDAADDADHVVAGRNRWHDRFSRLWARRFQREE